MEVQQQHQIQVQLTTSRRQPRQRVDAIMSQLNDETSFPSTNRSRRRMSSVSSSRPSLIFPSSSSYLFVLLVLLVQQTKYVVHGQYCVSFNNTWDGLVQTLQDSNGWAILCPFEISGDRCLPNYVGDVPIPPSSGEGGGGGVSLFASTPSSTKTVHSIYDEGYVVGNDENLFLICDPFMYRFDSQSSDCIINCPGRHFTIRPHAKLTLDRMTLNGATDTSIKIQSHGYLNTINTKFQNNVLENGNGGAISALGNSYVGIELSTFSGNSAFNGGAIYNMGYTDVNNTHFHGNSAIIGGGALYSGASSNTKLRQSDFVKNKAGYYGEAIYDRFNTDVTMAEVEGCGNEIVYRSNECNGVYVRVSRRQVDCVPFEVECTIPPTQSPTESPSSAPTTLSLGDGEESSSLQNNDESTNDHDAINGGINQEVGWMKRTPSPSSTAAPSESLYPSSVPTASSYPTYSVPSMEPSPNNVRRRKL